MKITNIPPTGDKCVYVHTRKTDGIVFYVGIGSIERSRKRSNRNAFWKNTVAKHDFEVDYLAQNVSVEEAKKIEIEAIKFYREQVGNKLTNISDGGEGGCGLIGEKNGNFGGHCLFYNLVEKIYWVSSGVGQMESDGFEQANVSRVKLNKIPFVSSTKIHKDGIKTRFKVHQSSDIDEITEFIVKHDLNEAELSDIEIRGQQGVNGNNFGRYGEKSSTFKGHYVGTSADKIIIISGTKMMEELGFPQSGLSRCVSGKRKTAKGFSWVQTIDLEQFKTTKLTPANDYTAQILQS